MENRQNTFGVGLGRDGQLEGKGLASRRRQALISRHLLGNGQIRNRNGQFAVVTQQHEKMSLLGVSLISVIDEGGFTVVPVSGRFVVLLAGRHILQISNTRRARLDIEAILITVNEVLQRFPAACNIGLNF